VTLRILHAYSCLSGEIPISSRFNSPSRRAPVDALSLYDPLTSTPFFFFFF